MTSEVKNKTYFNVQDEMDKLNISKKEKIIALLIALGSALLIVAGPIAIFANLMMFTNYQVTLAFLIALMVILFAFLSDFIYLHLITKRRVEGLYHVWSVDVLIVTFVVLIVCFILTKLVFKLF